MLKKLTDRLNKPLLLILLLALVVRLIGINHGFPFIFHPDEPSVVRSALGIRFNPNPEHFDWPHLYFYLNYVLFMVFAKVRTTFPTLSTIFPLVANDDLIFYLLSRIFSATLGAFTIIPIYLAGRDLFDKKTGLISALIFALLPFHIKQSHYALIDVPMLFWFTWALYFSVRIYLTDRAQNHVLAGLFAGLAASTKYNGGLVALCIVLAHIFRSVKAKENLLTPKSFMPLVYSAVAAVLGFLVGTPYALLDYQTFLITDSPKGALWQFVNVGKVTFVNQLLQFFDALTFKLPDDLGFTFFILYLCGVVYAFFKKPKLVFLTIPSLFFIFYISGAAKNRSHYYLTVYPFVALVSAFVFMDLFNKLKNRSKYLAISFIAVVFLVPAFLVSINSYKLLRPDTRVELYFWLQKNVIDIDYLVYSSQDARLVVRDFKTLQSTKLSPVIKLRSRQGYIVMMDADGNDVATLEAIKNLLRLETEISSVWRNGPDILIYSFGK